MKFVYLLEDDTKFQQEICEAISIVDPKIQIRLFPALEDFANWMRLMMTTGPAAIEKGGVIPAFISQEPVTNEEHQLVLVISKVEFLGADQLGLLKKTRNLFIERKICTAEDPTGIVLTAFDNPAFKIRDLEDRILNNVILKPFDRLILIQDLTFAIDGRHPPSKYTVANQKTTAVVEMLKDIELEAVSDVGMVTKSYREIPVGAVSKYYGQAFLSDRHRSLFAICRENKVHPLDPKAFQCSFTFFAADQTQIVNMRKKTRAKEATEFVYDWASPSTQDGSSKVNIILLDDEEDSPTGLKGQIEKKFESANIHSYRTFGAFLADLDPNLALQQNDQPVQALGGAPSVTLHFDPTGVTYLDFESEKKDLTHLFGVPLSEWKVKNNWLAHALIPSHRERYRQYIQTGQLQDDNVFSLTAHEHSFLIQVTAVAKDDGKFHITLKELSPAEQIQWLQKNSKLQDAIHLIIANHQLFNESPKERWTFVREQIQKRFGNNVQIVMTSKLDFNDAQERLLGSVIQDIYFKPVDRVYFIQKLKVLLPQLKEKGERTEIRTVGLKDTIKVVNPVTVTELSEAGVVMKYYRPIALGSFRELVLWQPYEIGSPELLATCNFVEENKGEKGVFNCHFVFFGIGDQFLKHIRIWIRDNYVLSKEGSAGS